MMNRRGFLQFMGLGAAALTLDPDKLLWVPGEKTIFLPPALAIPDLDAINQLTLKYITPGLLDAMWQKNTLLAHLQKGRMGFSRDTVLRENFIYDE